MVATPSGVPDAKRAAEEAWDTFFYFDQDAAIRQTSSDYRHKIPCEAVTIATKTETGWNLLPDAKVIVIDYIDPETKDSVVTWIRYGQSRCVLPRRVRAFVEDAVSQYERYGYISTSAGDGP